MSAQIKDQRGSVCQGESAREVLEESVVVVFAGKLEKVERGVVADAGVEAIHDAQPPVLACIRFAV